MFFDPILSGGTNLSKGENYICKRCKRNAAIEWWKCCPDHVALEGPEVLCQYCVEELHPGEEEFMLEDVDDLEE